MSIQILVTLPDPVYQQAQKVAQSTPRDVQEFLTEVITQNLQPFPVHENREDMLREFEAFKMLHPQLVNQFKGQYVAIFKGQMVDHDVDPVALLKRVKEHHPGKTVLQRKVEDNPDPVLWFRSPRLMSNAWCCWRLANS